MWTYEHSVETEASPAAIWALYTDVPGWPAWDKTIESSELQGPFEVGAKLIMKLYGRDAIESEIVEVKENALFANEVALGDLRLRFEHRLSTQPDARSRITHRVEAEGPGEAAIGPAVVEDLPDVMAGLAARAEGITGARA